MENEGEALYIPKYEFMKSTIVLCWSIMIIRNQNKKIKGE